MSGIGLALARELAELNGARLELLEGDSKTTFRLSLVADASDQACSSDSQLNDGANDGAPELDAPPRESSRGRISAARNSDSRSASAVPHRPRVLVVEDNADLRSSLERVLSAAFEVQLASSLLGAMGALSNSTPAAI